MKKGKLYGKPLLNFTDIWTADANRHQLSDVNRTKGRDDITSLIIT